MKMKRMGTLLATGFLVSVAFATLPGCEKKEKVVDIETPDGEVEVEKNKSTGEVDIELKRNKDKQEK